MTLENIDDAVTDVFEEMVGFDSTLAVCCRTDYLCQSLPDPICVGDTAIQQQGGYGKNVSSVCMCAQS